MFTTRYMSALELPLHRPVSSEALPLLCAGQIAGREDREGRDEIALAQESVAFLGLLPRWPRLHLIHLSGPRAAHAAPHPAAAALWERDAQDRPLVTFDSHPHLPKGQTQTDDGCVRVAASLDSGWFREKELAAPAHDFLCKFINENLLGRVSPWLQPGAGSVQGSNVPARAPVQLIPTGLAAAIWLQLALVVSGTKTLRQCQGCGKWFEVGEARSDKVYCGDACRKQAHQEKRLRACRLHESGKRPKEIAVEVGVDVDQVRKWVAKKRG
jgi:hypothetical protein